MPDSLIENIDVLTTGEPIEEQLRVITGEHPYYSVARFHLVSDYKKNNHSDFERQAAVASLFFNNQQWFHWQLSRNNSIEEENESNVAISPPQAESAMAPAFIAQVNNEEAVAFEPLHTIDYFASQGIKLSDEALANDKLGSQLKSFTEWLKSMKKIHTEKSAQGDEETDKMIRQIAESSNANISVVTEAMAEVLLNQGKVDQAIAMYNKLCLSDPSKKAYFAAKINSLKPV